MIEELIGAMDDERARHIPTELLGDEHFGPLIRGERQAKLPTDAMCGQNPEAYRLGIVQRSYQLEDV